MALGVAIMLHYDVASATSSDGLLILMPCCHLTVLFGLPLLVLLADAVTVTTE